MTYSTYPTKVVEVDTTQQWRLA